MSQLTYGNYGAATGDPVLPAHLRPQRELKNPVPRGGPGSAWRHCVYADTVSLRCGSFQPGRGKWQVYPFG